MRQYEIRLEGWVTDVVFVTAANRVDALEQATREFINRKGVENCRADVVETEEYQND